MGQCKYTLALNWTFLLTKVFFFASFPDVVTVIPEIKLVLFDKFVKYIQL